MMMTGTVLWFDIQKGYGFIKTEDGKDVFAHFSKIIAPEGEFRTLDKGDVVEFELFMSERNGVEKPQAKDIKVITKGVEDEALPKRKDTAFRGPINRPEADSVL